MRKQPFVIAVATAILGTGVGIFAAQHIPGRVSDQPVASNFNFMHSCDRSNDGPTAKPHVPAELARALELTEMQSADIDRIGVDACQAMSEIHERMMGVLTPDQRAKFQEMHAVNHSVSTIHEWFRKLHGR